MVAEREVDMHKHWSRSSIVITVYFFSAMSSQPNISIYPKLMCDVISNFTRILDILGDMLSEPSMSLLVRERDHLYSNIRIKRV